MKNINKKSLIPVYLGFVMIITFCNPLFAAAADKVVMGRVTNEAGDPIEGVNISIANTSTGTSTDANGAYSINVNDNDVLVFSYVGFEPQEVRVGSKSVINIILTSTSNSLSNVVVTALGIKRQAKSLTYSTQTVNAQKLTEAREPNILSSLSGKVAGLNITGSGGGVGGDVRVVLRGNRSINGDSQPLYVIDGVPMAGGITDLSPDNIASINVLKGANAAALYGSSAQDGAIIIETKRGMPSAIHVSLNQTFMVQRAYGLIPFQYEYGQGSGGQYFQTAEMAWGAKLDGHQIRTWSLDPADSLNKYAYSAYPDTKLDVFRKGYNSATNVSLSTGGERMQSLFNYTYTDAKGIIPNNDLKRHNASLRLTTKLTDKLTFDARFEYIQQLIKNQPIEGASPINTVMQIYTMPPNIRMEDIRKFEYTSQSGDVLQNYWNNGTSIGQNPYWLVNRALSNNNRNRALLNGSLTYALLPSLKIMGRIAYDGYNGFHDLSLSNSTYNDAPLGKYYIDYNRGFYLSEDVLLTYSKDITTDFDIRFDVGGSAQKWRGSDLYNNTNNALIVANLFSINNTTVPSASSNAPYKENKNAVYAFTTLGWKKGLYLDLTARNEWSSTLPKPHSYFYPSAGLSAILTDIVTALPDAISFAKIRASYAQSGKGTSAFRTVRYASAGLGGNNGFITLDPSLPAKDLKPEKTNSIEIGADVRFFDNRFGLDFTAYKTNTINQLIPVAAPVGSGASVFFKNGGDVQNKGIELVTYINPVKTQNFNWDVSINYAANRNKVLRIDDSSPRLVIAANDGYFKDFVIEEGQPYGNLYSRGWLRDSIGRVLIDDNGMPMITDGKTVLVANFNPKWIAGLINNLTYKNFSLGFVIDRRQGGTMVSASQAVLDGMGLTERTLLGRDGNLIFGSNIFQNEHAILESTRAKNNMAVSAQDFWSYVGGLNDPKGEAFISDATSMRLREVTLGYTIANELLKNTPVKDLKISLVGRNLLYLQRASKYVDPDVMLGTDKTSEGFQSYNPPTSRYYGINLKVNF